MSPRTVSRILLFGSLCLLLTAAGTVAAAAANKDQPQQPQRRSLSFAPFLGCDDDWAYGIPQDDDDCYAVDSDTCSFLYNRQCREVTASYRYYNGGVTREGTEPFPEAIYHEVSISALLGCNSGTSTQQQPPSRCTITVDGETCNRCTNSDTNNFRTVTLEDCRNIPGVFASLPQTISLLPGGGHFQLAYAEDRCQHPALEGLTPPPVKTMTVLPQFQYSMVSTTGAALVPPDTAAIATLVANTQAYFSSLLRRLFGNDNIRAFSIDQWTSRYSSSSSATPVGSAAELFVNLNMTLTLAEASTITAQEITDYMVSPPALNGYLQRTVQTTDPVFASTEQVTATVLGNVVP